MKIKKSYLKFTALLSGIVMAGIVAIILTTNATAVNQEDYASLKNGVELQSEVLALNSPDTNLKCGEGEGEKKCGEGDRDAAEKTTEGKAKAADGEKKCGEGKCGEGDGDAAESSDEGAAKTE